MQEQTCRRRYSLYCPTPSSGLRCEFVAVREKQARCVGVFGAVRADEQNTLHQTLPLRLWWVCGDETTECGM